MKNTLLRRSNLQWFTPGLHVKRWLLLMIAGIALIGLSAGYVLVEIYREAPLPEVFYYLTLQFLPRWLRALVVGGIGIGAFAFGLYRLSRTLLASVRGNDTQPIVSRLMQQRIASHGPRVVAIGGGHGLAALLRGLKHQTTNITAVVTVADDGGSSGRLRKEFGMLPPGDFRMCISALADDESLVSQLMQYRFGGNSGLGGHSFGNLFIAAMAELTGSFERAILESSKVVASQGRILPSTLTDVTLCAEYKEPQLAATSGAVGAGPVRGESSIGKAGLPIERVWLEPHDPPAYPEAVRAILEADLVVLGPGSLFTSVMPNLLVPGIVQALRQTRAQSIYVCNVATERGETDRLDMSDHVNAIERHIGRNVIDAVLANDHIRADFALPSGVDIVVAEDSVRGSSVRVVPSNLADDREPWRHDSRRLTDALLRLLKTQTQT
jgi:uncharacterized cofD-like protein